MSDLQFSREELQEIVIKASTIDERLHPEDAGLPTLVHDDRIADEEQIQKRLQEWCETLSGGDWRLFHRRLAWDGLDESSLRSCLGAVRFAQHNAPLPAWVETLQTMLRETGSQVAGAAEGADSDTAQPLYAGDRAVQTHLLGCDPATPLPFEELLLPFVIVARKRLQEHTGPAYSLLADSAHAALHRSLLKALATYAAQSFFLEFSIEINLTQSTLDRFLQRNQPVAGRACYLRFVRRMQRGGLRAFFKEYAVLARQLALLTDRWVDAQAEFLQRLASDWSCLGDICGNASDRSQVTRITTDLSDPHRGRRSVLALTFANGGKVIYKPRDLGIEAAYQRLLSWCNKQGITFPFKEVAILERPGYGWVEFVEHRPCRNQEEARRYFQRGGMLLCLMYLLEGTDCHRGNLIAHGDQPVLVDCEALLQHRRRFDDMPNGAMARFIAHEQLEHSVLRSGLLPSWQVREDARGQHIYDISGLGGVKNKEEQIETLLWEQTNTDQMTVGIRLRTVQIEATAPMLNDAFLQLEDYSAETITGFRLMYGFLMQHRVSLLSEDSPLWELGRQQVRFVHRDTQVYARLSHKLLAPRFQRDGISRAIQLELLGRAFLPLNSLEQVRLEPSAWWPLFAAERQAMQQEDIPYFTAYANSATLQLPPDRELPHLFQGGSFALVLERLNALCNADMERQISYILGTLYVMIAHSTPSEQMVTERPLLSDIEYMPEKAELVTQARAIADQVARRAIRAGDGSASWIAPQFIYRAERYQLQTLNFDFYLGSSGVALFLAAMAKITGNAEYRTLALGAVQHVRFLARKHSAALTHQIGIGGCTGLGSVIYTLTKIGLFLDDVSLLADAREAALLVTDEAIAADNMYDVFEGAAGALLGLVALYEVLPDKAVLERAQACARFLLRVRKTSAQGLRAWGTLNEKILAGFSHGVAGIAYALLRLAPLAPGGDDYRTAAQEAIAYEDSLFVPEVGNWPDLRMDEGQHFVTSWCHGAPGIGLARLGSLPALDTPQVRYDIAEAVQTTRNFGLHGVDFLCCGNFGRLDVLLTAGQCLRQADLIAQATRQAWQLAMHAQQAETYALDRLLPKELYNPSFFQGTTGIGYTLLRLAYPQELPCVLMWE